MFTYKLLFCKLDHMHFTNILLFNCNIYLSIILLLVQAMAGFFSYFVTMGSFGFMPWTLIGVRTRWENKHVTGLQDSYGQEWVAA